MHKNPIVFSVSYYSPSFLFTCCLWGFLLGCRDQGYRRICFLNSQQTNCVSSLQMPLFFFLKDTHVFVCLFLKSEFSSFTYKSTWSIVNTLTPTLWFPSSFWKYRTQGELFPPVPHPLTWESLGEMLL